MRMVRVPRLDRNVSAIGFGCASLGSRISAADGQRAIARAIDLGVSWFDVAPPYGDGHAEALLGQGLRGRRDKVVVCTKFGIAAPQVSFAARLIRPAARQVVATIPALRRVASKARATGARAAIDPAMIETSVARSLQSLGTDYIDVLALHDPSQDDAANDAIFDVLRRLVDKGYIRAVSIAGAPDSIIAAVRSVQPIDIAQFPDMPFTNAAPLLRSRLPAPQPMFVTHSVFGAVGAIARIDGSRQHRIAAIAEQYGIDGSNAAQDLPLRFAFSNNPDGVVIISMFNTSHMERNIAASIAEPTPGFALAVRRALASTPAHAAVP
ncbi:aldo/keto reductase [Bradyrhizobium liaoningense]|nr:aldo/keto reductase [Bradyrhizobium liaoningense]